MPFTETRRSPGTNSAVLGWRRHAGRDFGRILLLSGVSPWMGCPMMGSEGPAVQADSTWYSERRVVRPTAIVADLTVPVVRAAVARQAGLRPRAQSATPPLQLPDLRSRTHQWLRAPAASIKLR